MREVQRFIALTTQPYTRSPRPRAERSPLPLSLSLRLYTLVLTLHSRRLSDDCSETDNVLYVEFIRYSDLGRLNRRIIDAAVAEANFRNINKILIYSKNFTSTTSEIIEFFIPRTFHCNWINILLTRNEN